MSNMDSSQFDDAIRNRLQGWEASTSSMQWAAISGQLRKVPFYRKPAMWVAAASVVLAFVLGYWLALRQGNSVANNQVQVQQSTSTNTAPQTMMGQGSNEENSLLGTMAQCQDVYININECYAQYTTKPLPYKMGAGAQLHMLNYFRPAIPLQQVSVSTPGNPPTVAATAATAPFKEEEASPMASAASGMTESESEGWPFLPNLYQAIAVAPVSLDDPQGIPVPGDVQGSAPKWAIKVSTLPTFTYHHVTPYHGDETYVTGLNGPGSFSTERLGFQTSASLEHMLSPQLAVNAQVLYADVKGSINYQTYGNVSDIDFEEQDDGSTTLTPRFAVEDHSVTLNTTYWGLGLGLRYRLWQGYRASHWAHVQAQALSPLSNGLLLDGGIQNALAPRWQGQWQLGYTLHVPLAHNVFFQAQPTYTRSLQNTLQVPDFQALRHSAGMQFTLGLQFLKPKGQYGLGIHICNIPEPSKP